MTREQLDELHERMVHHKVKNNVAIVELTAAELHELLTCIDRMDLALTDIIKEYDEYGTRESNLLKVVVDEARKACIK